MAMLYCSVRNQGLRNQRYGLGQGSSRTLNSGTTQKIAIQGFLYTSVLVLSNGPIVAHDLRWYITGISSLPHLIIAHCCEVLHSFFYLCFFLRTRVEMRTKFGKFVRANLLRLWKVMTVRLSCCGDYCCFCLTNEESSRDQADWSTAIVADRRVNTSATRSDTDRDAETATRFPNLSAISERSTDELESGEVFK